LQVSEVSLAKATPEGVVRPPFCLRPRKRELSIRMRHRHQLDSPIGRCAVIVFTVPSAEIDRRRWLSAFLTSQARQEFPKAHIATLLDQQAHRKECRAPAAVQFELALRPVGKTVREAEGRRMHGRTV
jgi:hypothetical protein